MALKNSLDAAKILFVIEYRFVEVMVNLGPFTIGPVIESPVKKRKARRARAPRKSNPRSAHLAMRGVVT